MIKSLDTVERERERETYVLVNKTGLVFMLKNSEYYVNKERVY